MVLGEMRWMKGWALPLVLVYKHSAVFVECKFGKGRNTFQEIQTKTGKAELRHVSPSAGLHQSQSWDWWSPAEGENVSQSYFSCLCLDVLKYFSNGETSAMPCFQSSSPALCNGACAAATKFRRGREEMGQGRAKRWSKNNIQERHPYLCTIWRYV